jgi:dihydroorotate dehydrogenase (fumarate)
MDLTTKYLGFELKNPIVPSASPLSKSIDQAKELEDNGAAALVMYSLFEEAITGETETMNRFLHHQDTGFAEAGDGFLPDWQDFSTGLEQYLDNLHKLKEALDIPVIASLNGVTPGGWISHGKELEQAGADALELNVYYVAADIGLTGAQVEDRYLDILRALKAQISIPINMKLSPSFSSVGNMVQRLGDAGADGVSLFNRFYQPDINIDSLRLQPSLHSVHVRSRRCSRCAGSPSYTDASTACRLGATGGIHTPEDAIKLLLAGSDAIHFSSILVSTRYRTDADTASDSGTRC